MSRPDVAIVGGGLIGRCLAWRASRSGARVALYDSANSQGMNSAAWVAAGMIAPTTEAIDSDAQISSMGANSLKLWPQWLAELPIPVFYCDNGTLLLWHVEDTGEVARVQSMLTSSRQSQSCVRCLEGSQVADIEPELGSRFARALYFPAEAQVDNRGFLKAVGLALEEAGVESHWRLPSMVAIFPTRELSWIAVAWAPRAICAVFEVFVARLCVCMHPRSN